MAIDEAANTARLLATYLLQAGCGVSLVGNKKKPFCGGVLFEASEARTAGCGLTHSHFHFAQGKLGFELQGDVPDCGLLVQDVLKILAGGCSFSRSTVDSSRHDEDRCAQFVLLTFCGEL